MDNQYQNEQERYKEEDLMAGGPVSAGASNKEAPMYHHQPPKERQANTRPAEQEQPDYNKLLHTDTSGTTAGSGMGTAEDISSPGASTLPTGGETGASRGGMNTSNSTVGAGGTAGGTVIGGGLTRDRGSSPDIDLDQNTNISDTLDRNSQGDTSGQSGSSHRGA